jgi:hypothetical protein
MKGPDLPVPLRFGSNRGTRFQIGRCQRDGGEVHRWGRFLARARSMSTATAVPVISHGNGGMDGVRQVTASSEVRSASLIVSCRGAEGRLECFGRRVSYGRGWLHHFATKLDKRVTLEGVSKQGKENRTREREFGGSDLTGFWNPCPQQWRALAMKFCSLAA